MKILKTMPPKVSVGDQFTAQIVITALESVAEVVVKDTVPEGATYVSATPAASVDGRTLTWALGEMDKGGTATLNVVLQADREGTLSNCAWVSAHPKSCATTVVGKAAVTIQKSGPAVAILGDEIEYSIVVRNTGTSLARGVVMTDTMEEGLTPVSGQAQSAVQLGDLAPGDAKEIKLKAKAGKRGKFKNEATVTSQNAGRGSAEVVTVVQQRGLNLAKTGTKEQFIGKTATYTIVAANTGDVKLTDVVVTDVVPEPYTVQSSAGAEVSGRNLTWKVGDLEAGAEKTFTLTALCRNAGSFVNTAKVTSREGLTSQAQAETLWRGMVGMLIQLSDDPDPIQVGETTTYKIEVTNQGNADDTDIRIVARFPAQTSAVSAGGATEAQVTDKLVTFAPYARLQGKQKITWTIQAKGVAVGDSRIKVELTSELLKLPVSQEESTQVY